MGFPEIKVEKNLGRAIALPNFVYILRKKFVSVFKHSFG